MHIRQQKGYVIFQKYIYQKKKNSVVLEIIQPLRNNKINLKRWRDR